RHIDARDRGAHADTGPGLAGVQVVGRQAALALTALGFTAALAFTTFAFATLLTALAALAPLAATARAALPRRRRAGLAGDRQAVLAPGDLERDLHRV